RIGFVTTSGGTVDLLYDYAETEGAQIPDFSAATKSALMPLMQEGIDVKNPLDSGTPPPLKVAGEICQIVARDPGIDMVAWAAQLARAKDSWNDLSPLHQLLQSTDKPVLGFGRMAYQVNAASIEMQERIGFPFLQGLEGTLRAL